MSDSPRTSLRRVLDDLGRTVLDVVATPAGLSTEGTDAIGGVVIHDASDEPLLPERAIVLGVGVSGPAAVVALLRHLADHDVAALVLRAPVEVDDAVQAAVDASGCVLLGLTRGAAWTQVATLLRSVVADDDLTASTPEMLGGTPAGDLFALANAISALIDAPLTIEDRSSRLLAFSGRQDEADESRIEVILGRQVPQRYAALLDAAGVFHELYGNPGPVFVDKHRLGRPEVAVSRTAVAVRAGDEILGSMWAATAEPLTAERAQAFLDSTRLVALHLLRARAGADAERRVRADLLDTVLRGDRGAGEAAGRLGLLQGSSVVLAAAAVDDGEVDPEADLEAVRQRMADAFAVHLSAVHQRAAAALVNGVAYGILPLGGPSPRHAASAERIAQEFLRRSEQRFGTVIGVGRVCAGLVDVSRSRADADRVLQVLRRDGVPRRVATIAQVHAEALMLELGELASAQDLADFGPVPALVDYDRRHGADLVQTLRVWLDTFGDVARSATRLAVHANTLRYRLRRIEAVSGLDLADPDARFAALLQLRLDPPHR